MDAIVVKLDAKLREWKPEISAKVSALVAEIIDLVDSGSLDLMRSRAFEQEVLDLLDKPYPGEVWLAGKHQTIMP